MDPEGSPPQWAGAASPRRAPAGWARDDQLGQPRECTLLPEAGWQNAARVGHSEREQRTDVVSDTVFREEHDTNIHYIHAWFDLYGSGKMPVDQCVWPGWVVVLRAISTHQDPIPLWGSRGERIR